MVAQYEQVSTIALKGASKDSIREPNSILVPGLFLLLHSSAGSVEEEAVTLSLSPGRGRLHGKVRVVAPARDVAADRHVQPRLLPSRGHRQRGASGLLRACAARPTTSISSSLRGRGAVLEDAGLRDRPWRELEETAHYMCELLALDG